MYKKCLPPNGVFPPDHHSIQRADAVEVPRASKAHRLLAADLAVSYFDSALRLMQHLPTVADLNESILIKPTATYSFTAALPLL